MSNKRRPKTRRAVRNVLGVHTENKPRTRATAAFVVPDVMGMLNDLKHVVGTQIKAMKADGTIGDTNGMLIRNLSATLSSIQDTESRTQEEDDYSRLSPADLAKRLRAEADAIDGMVYDEEREAKALTAGTEEDDDGTEE